MSNAKSTVKVSVSDMTGQRRYVLDLPKAATWGEALDTIVNRDAPLRPLGQDGGVLIGRHEREGRHLHPSELAGDIFREDQVDEVTIHRELQGG